jgi:transcriptional regulator
MYTPPAFKTDRAASLAFAAERGFGLVVACDGGKPLASPLPFHLSYASDGSPRVGFHVAGKIRSPRLPKLEGLGSSA